MLFNHLTGKLSPFILAEKYHPYDIPTKKTKEWGGNNELLPAETNKYLMYDFYVLDYLKFLVDNMSPKQFRELNPDLKDSVHDAVKKLYPYLRQELLDAVFYSMCAEFRNSTQVGAASNLHRLPENSRERKLYADWLKYMKAHRGSYTADDLEILNIKKPSSDIRTPATEKNNALDRNLSYKAANYSMKENNSTRSEFTYMMQQVFETGVWNGSYGGDAWGRIAKGWQVLNESDQITPRTKQSIDSLKKPMGVAIDHVYDLQHNTDTVLNKLKSYYHPRSGHGWIGTALDDKKNVTSYHDLLKNASGSVKSMALPVLYNRLGGSWEEHMRKTNPDEIYDRPAEEKKKKDLDDKEAKLLQKLQDKKDLNSDKENDEPNAYAASAPGKQANELDTNVGDIVICVDVKGIEKNFTLGNKYEVLKVENKITVRDDFDQPYSTFYFRFHTTGETMESIKQKNSGKRKLYTKEEMEEFPEIDQFNTIVGDKVIVYNNGGVDKYLTIGKAYEVLEINNAVIEIVDNGNHKHSYAHFRFRKVVPTKTSKKPNYSLWKHGDLLKCIDNEGVEETLSIGQIYRADGDPVPVTAIKTKGYFISVVDMEDNTMGSFNTNRFENVTIQNTNDTGKEEKSDIANYLQGIGKTITSPPIKPNLEVGDLVKHKKHGMEGKIRKLFDAGNGEPGVQVKLPSGLTASWKARYVDQIIEYPTEQNSVAGDWILCINDSNETNHVKNGEKYKIADFMTFGYVTVIDDHGNYKELSKKRFKVIPQPKASTPEPTKEPEYKVGDRVQYTTGEPKIYTGKVIDIKKHNNQTTLLIYFKELQDQINLQANDPHLKKTTSLPKPESIDPPKVGDNVIVTIATGQKVDGKLSDITASGTKGWVDVQKDGGFHLSSWYFMDQIKKVPRLFKQKVESEESPEVNDDVSVLTPDGNYLYGTLAHINREKDIGYVSIPTISGHGKSDWFELSKIKKDVKI